jgi:hypothetical protein
MMAPRKRPCNLRSKISRCYNQHLLTRHILRSRGIIIPWYHPFRANMEGTHGDQFADLYSFILRKVHGGKIPFILTGDFLEWSRSDRTTKKEWT